MGKIKEGGVARALLERLSSTTKMADVVRLVKRKRIPEEYHEQLIQKAAGWASDSTHSNQAGTSISIKGAVWWDHITQQRASRIKQLKEEARFRAFMDAYGDVPLEQAALHILGKIQKPVEKIRDPFIHLNQGAEFFDTLADKDLTRLQGPLTRVKDSYLDCARKLEAILWKIEAIKDSREKEINPIVEPLLLATGNV